MTEPWRLLALPPTTPAIVEGIVSGLCVEVAFPAERTPEAVRSAVGEADIVLGDWSSALRVDAQVLAAGPRLAAVVQPSVGVDSLDLDVLAAAGIPVVNAAGANTDAVAEWCLAASLACLRLLLPADTEVRAGAWPQTELAGRGSRELAGARVGIVGFGAIGQACARLFRALGCDVAQWSRTRREATPWLELDVLVARSDVLVVVVALADTTRGLIDAGRLTALPAGAVVVDASRGGIVDHGALAALVRGGALSAAALDVFATEPLPPDSPLRGDPRVLLSPHAAGASRQAQLRILRSVRVSVERIVRVEPLVGVVNGAPPLVVRRRKTSTAPH